MSLHCILLQHVERWTVLYLYAGITSVWIVCIGLHVQSDCALGVVAGKDKSCSDIANLSQITKYNTIFWIDCFFYVMFLVLLSKVFRIFFGILTAHLWKISQNFNIQDEPFYIFLVHCWVLKFKFQICLLYFGATRSPKQLILSPSIYN